MIKVCKFGGSSMANATQFSKVKNIVLGDDARQVVVVSALGKRESKDTKITDLLYTLAAHLKYGVAYDDIWSIFYNRFVGVKEELGIDYDIEKDLLDLKADFSKKTSKEFLVSRGEYFTAKLISIYLGYTFVDAKDLIIFNYDGTINYEVTEEKVKEAHMQYGKIVVPGFYGSYPNGQIKLLSRGGSDITGSILAKSVNASVYENWTDVSGIYAADPRLVKNPRNISQITYAELREMSYMGANVLHEETIFPVQELQIPINIKNTNEPDHPGTMIQNVCDDNKYVVTGITGKDDFIAFNISKDHMSTEVGFFRKVLSIFEKYNIAVEHSPSGIDTISIVCEGEACNKYLYEIIGDIKAMGADVSVDSNLALIAIVGRNMVGQVGLFANFANTLGRHNINIKMIDMGPTELTFIIGVAKDDYKKAISYLYEEAVA